MDAIGWVHAVRPLTPGRDLATNAVGYSLKEAELRRVLEDPALPVDNTRAERLGSFRAG